MTIYQYGEQAAENVLIQLVGEHELPTLEDEVREIQKMTERPFSYCGKGGRVESGTYTMESTSCIWNRRIWRRGSADTG